MTKEDMKYYQVSSLAFSEVMDNKDKDLVFQYTVKFT